MPSSPYGPWSIGKTTSTSPRAFGTAPGSVSTTSRLAGSTERTTTPSPDSARSATFGRARSAMAMRSGASAVSAQRPSVVMPMGSTSYLSRSMALRTAPAVTTEMACSELRPPKTTATRGLRGLWVFSLISR